MWIIFSALYRMMKNGQRVVMPAPVDSDTPHAKWEAERVEVLAPHLGRAGFTHYLWPPLTMSQGRTAANADGYGKQYDLNIGQWSPTRWGTAQQVLAANKVLHTCGLMVMEDAVIHQYDGGNRQSYIELGANGRADPKLFPKFPGCFVPNAAVDNVFDPEGNWPDGDMVSFYHSVPKGYMLKGVIQAMAFRKRVLALDGWRGDEAKGEDTRVFKAIDDALGGDNVCEVYTGNPDELEQYVKLTGLKVMDFTWRWAAKAACEGGSFRGWVNAGLVARDPDHSILFGDSADTDQNDQAIRFNKIWLYFRGLTIPAAGLEVYAADYLPERYNLQKLIDNAVWISRTFAFGPLKELYADDSFIAWSRNGDGGKYGWSGGLLCAMNRDPINRRGMWLPTPFGPNKHLHNYAPTYGPDIWTNDDGWVYVECGPNVNGSALSYVAYAEAGVDRPIPIVPVKHEPAGSMTDFISITVGEMLPADPK